MFVHEIQTSIKREHILSWQSFHFLESLSTVDAGDTETFLYQMYRSHAKLFWSSLRNNTLNSMLCLIALIWKIKCRSFSVCRLFRSLHLYLHYQIVFSVAFTTHFPNFACDSVEMLLIFIEFQPGKMFSINVSTLSISCHQQLIPSSWFVQNVNIYTLSDIYYFIENVHITRFNFHTLFNDIYINNICQMKMAYSQIEHLNKNKNSKWVFIAREILRTEQKAEWYAIRIIKRRILTFRVISLWSENLYGKE